MSSNNSKDPNLTQEEQEQASAEKAGELAGRAIADYATGGEYEKLRSAPIVGDAAKKAEEKVGKAVGKADKATGGKLGKAAKKLDDVGALDAVDQGMGMLGGGGKEGGNLGKNNAAPKPGTANQTPTTSPPKQELSSSNSPHPEQAPDVSHSQNFAKNGLQSTGGNDIVPSEGTGPERKRMSEINDRKKEAEEESSSNEKPQPDSGAGKSQDSDKTMAKVTNIAIFVMVQQVIAPIFAAIFIILIFTICMLAVHNDDNDLAGVDTEGGYGGYSSDYYANMSPEKRAFYERVLKNEEEYSDKGKTVNSMYITATYHIMTKHNQYISTNDFDDDLIDEMSEAMLGGSSTYNENNYRKYLTEEFFPRYNCSEKTSEIYTDEVFEYIENYLEKNGRSSSCSGTTGGSCTYSIPGVHGYDNSAINVSNLQVRLMSSSFCNGTDNVALDEDLVPFEKYVLGVTYGEIGEAFNTEVEKVHMIAARSFALARPRGMGNSLGVKYVNEGGQNILQLRACVADQVFCNTDLGCSKDVAAGNQYGVVYSGKSHPYVYKDELSNHPNATLKSSWEETMGMIGVDKDGKVVSMGYAVGNGNKDDWVWKRWAEQGMDYVQIILSAYPEIKEIKKMDCATTTESVDSNFLQVASKVWKEIANNNTKYYMGGLSVPPPTGLVDCSTFVSWVLYEYGFQEEFGGGQHNTVAFLNTNWNEKFGWEEIPVAAGEDVTSKLQPGDILVRDTGAGGANGHINIIGEITEDGRVLAYDCGAESNWNNATARAGKPVDRSSFAKSDYRSGKIIRVSNVSGSTCNSAESGEWSTWRQYAPAPWSEVPLGNSGRTIGGYGCFVTSIAIQIARSGAQTTLSEFNPGTFVQELNKYGSFDGYGNFIGGANIPKIVPSFQIVDAGVSLPADKNGKIRTIQNYIDQGYYVILRVKTTTGQHWVAVIGTTSDGLQMVDPGSDATMVWDQYPVSESSTINIYKIG